MEDRQGLDILSSRILWNSVITEADSVVTVLDCNGIVRYVNQLKDGFSLESIIGRSATDFASSSAYEEVQMNLRKAYNGETTSFQSEVLHSSAQTQWWETTYHPIKNNQHVEGIVAHSQNISEQKKAEKDEALLIKLVESTPDFVTIYDSNFFLRYANHEHGQWDKGSLIGKSIEEIVGPIEGDRNIQFFLQSKDTEKMVRFETSVFSPKGGHIFFENRVVYLNQGDFAQYMCLSRDITEEKDSQELIERQQMRMQETSKWAAMGEMSAGIAHEINNPLSIVLAAASKIERALKSGEKVDVDKLLHSSKMIKKAGKRIQKIMHGLKTYSREGSGDEFILQDMNSLLQDSIEMCQASLSDFEIDLEVIALKEPARVYCRPGQILQVMVNLINNSRDAISGLDKRWIKVQLEDLDHQIEVSIIDSGHGIPEDIRNKIIQPFFTTKDVGKGTGLGLSLSKTILLEHGGDLVIDNNNENTCFKFQLSKFPLKISSIIQ